MSLLGFPNVPGPENIGIKIGVTMDLCDSKYFKQLHVAYKSFVFRGIEQIFRYFCNYYLTTYPTLNMKKLLRSFVIIAVFCHLFGPGQAQTSTDTFSLHVVTRFWKTNQATKEVTLEFQGWPFTNPLGLVSVSTAADSSTIILKYVLDSLANDYCYTARKEGDPINGVNVGDMVRIARHILSLEPFSSDFAKLAADANRSNTITTYDIVEFNKLILGIYQELPVGTSWRLLPENFFTTFDGCHKIPQMPLSQVDTSRLLSLKTGDVDGDANPAGPYQLPQNSSLLLGVPNTIVQAGQTVWLPIATAQNVTLTGIQFGIKFDPALMEIKDVRSGAMDWTAGNFGVFQDAFSCVGIRPSTFPINFPASTVLMEIQLKALQSFSPHQAIAISNEKLPGLWVDEDLVLHPLDTTFAVVSAQVEPIAPGVAIGLPTPNPFVDKTSISLVLERPSVVYLELTDVSGKLQRRQSFELSPGQHNLEVSGDGVPANSLLFYRVWSESWSRAGKILHR